MASRVRKVRHHPRFDAAGRRGPARRIGDPRLRLSALDFWLIHNRSADLLTILNEADADPFRDSVRTAVQRKDDAREGTGGRRPAAFAQPVWFALALGRLGEIAADRRIQILKLALRSQPSNLGVLMELGGCFDSSQADTAMERIRWYQVATSVRPTNAIAHSQLGAALHHRGDLDGVLAAFSEAVWLDPKLASPHVGIGARYARGDRDGAIAEWREAIRLDASAAATPHSNIGGVLAEKGDAAGAIAESSEAIRLDPNLACGRHNNLANAMLLKGDAGGAAEAAAEAVRLDPKQAKAHLNRLPTEPWDIAIGRSHPIARRFNSTRA